MTFERDELEYALEESVKLQSHYAKILNGYDGGRRLEFQSTEDWMLRLRKIQDDKWNTINDNSRA